MRLTSAPAINAPDLTAVYRALADAQRRRILTLLLDRNSPVSLDELAVHLVAAEQDKSLLDVTESEAESINIPLVHNHLPTLEDAHLVARPSDDTITTRDHPALQISQFRTLLDEADDDIFRGLAHPYRRIIIAQIRQNEADVGKLVGHIHQYEVDHGVHPPPLRKTIHTELVHTHLPLLDSHDLVTYDATRGTVGPSVQIGRCDEWIEAERSIVARHAEIHPSSDIIHLNDNAEATEYAQRLADYAEDELFIMYTDMCLVREACLRRLEDAIERGVDVYVGTQNSTLRCLVRERLPEATLWEPQRDWMNLRAEHDNVGRLIFADREAIMLGTLSATNEYWCGETAIAGTGHTNALVILVRELLGSRLDHLDEQSDDFLEHIPF